MEQRLKERMIGAIVLVAIAILLIPALLDGPGQETVRKELELDTGARSRTVELALDGQAPKPATREISAQQVKESPRKEKPVEPPPASTAVAKTPPPKTAATPKPEPPKTAATPKPEPPKPEKEVARAAPATPAAAGNWAAQVGSFAKESSASRITRELKAGGFDAYVSEIRQGGRTLYRVRVGPVVSRAEADALVARLSAGGHAAKVMPHP